MEAKNKQGISLIVLVITIIVMIILAGAIILSLNSSNIIGRAEEAKTLSDDASKRQIANVALGEFMLMKQEDPNITETAGDYVERKLQDQGINTDNVAVVDNKVIVGSGDSFIKQEQSTENPLEKGDYIKYTPDVKTSTKYKMFDNPSGQETSAFVTEAGIKWRYMGVDNTGNALIVSDRSTTGILCLEYAEGYLQGPTKLNELCKELYSGSKGKARSINIEDVNKILETKSTPYFYNASGSRIDLPL